MKTSNRDFQSKGKIQVTQVFVFICFLREKNNSSNIVLTFADAHCTRFVSCSGIGKVGKVGKAMLYKYSCNYFLFGQTKLNFLFGYFLDIMLGFPLDIWTQKSFKTQQLFVWISLCNRNNYQQIKVKRMHCARTMFIQTIRRRFINNCEYFEFE